MRKSVRTIGTKWGKAVAWEDVLKAFRRANVWRLAPAGVFGFERKGERWMWKDDFEALMAYLKRRRAERAVSRVGVRPLSGK